MAAARDVTIPLADGSTSGLLLIPDAAGACYVMAHGAGAGTSGGEVGEGRDV